MPRVAKKTTAKSRTSSRSSAKRSSTVKRRVLHGRGGYWDDVKTRWGAGGGEMKNKFGDVGHLLGGPGGRAIGELLNRGLYALTGFGDYKIQKNALLETNDPPGVVNRGKEFIVRHREFITDVYSSPSNAANSPSPFNIQGFSVQPADFSTFPWLSQVASKFEQYRIEGMIFEYKAMYSDAVVTQNGAIGNIILATQYNAGQPAFPNKLTMENYEFAQSCKPSMSVIHPVECARSQNVLSELYIRSGAVPAGEDVKTYDFADFYVASVGIPTAAANTPINLGELWISYQIAFMKPKIYTSSGTYIDSGYSHFTTTQTSANYGNTSVFPAAVMTSSSNIAGVKTTGGSLDFPRLSVAMNYLVQIQWLDTATGQTAGWTSPTNTLFGGATAVNIFGNGTQTAIPNISQTGVGAYFSMVVNIPASTGGVQVSGISFSAFTVPAGLNIKMDMFINALPLSVN